MHSIVKSEHSKQIVSVVLSPMPPICWVYSRTPEAGVPKGAASPVNTTPEKGKGLPFRAGFPSVRTHFCCLSIPARSAPASVTRGPGPHWSPWFPPPTAVHVSTLRGVRCHSSVATFCGWPGDTAGQARSALFKYPSTTFPLGTQWLTRPGPHSS